MKKYQLIVFDWEGTLMSPTKIIYPGVAEVLTELRQQNYLLAVATNRYRHSLERLLFQFQMQDFFHATRCADETQSKPDPAMLIEILDELSVSAAQAVMVGDSESDIIMAKAASVDFISINYEAVDNREIMKHHPIICLTEIRQLLEYL